MAVQHSIFVVLVLFLFVPIGDLVWAVVKFMIASVLVLVLMVGAKLGLLSWKDLFNKLVGAQITKLQNIIIYEIISRVQNLSWVMRWMRDMINPNIPQAPIEEEEENEIISPTIPEILVWRKYAPKEKQTSNTDCATTQANTAPALNTTEHSNTLIAHSSVPKMQEWPKIFAPNGEQIRTDETSAIQTNISQTETEINISMTIPNSVPKMQERSKKSIPNVQPVQRRVPNMQEWPKYAPNEDLFGSIAKK